MFGIRPDFGEMKEIDMIHGNSAHGGFVAALLAFALVAGCSRPPAEEPQAASNSAAQPAPPAVETSEVIDTRDAEVKIVIDDDAAAPPVAEASALRDSFNSCLQAAGGVDAAMQDCIGSEYDYQDGRLNVVYAELKRTLDDAKMAELRTAQRQWLSDRDSKCVWDAKTEGSAQRLQANQCRLDATALRAAELEAMR